MLAKIMFFPYIFIKICSSQNFFPPDFPLYKTVSKIYIVFKDTL